MAAWTFRSVGTIAQSSSPTQTPGAPAGVVATDLLLIACSQRNNSFTVSSTPSGWVRIDPQSHDTYNGFFVRIADGTAGDNPPTITWSGTAQCSVQMAAFSGGGYSDASTIVHAIVDQSGAGAGGSGNDIAYSALTISLANCLVIVKGMHNKTTTGNGVTCDAFGGGFTQIAQINPNGAVFSFYWGYLQQTTATNFGATTQTRSGGTAEALQQSSLVIALKTASAASAANKAFLLNQQMINNG